MLIGRTRNANFCYTAPPNVPGCQDLWVRRDVHSDGTQINTSAWYPTPEELKLLNTGQPIYLSIFGSGHPVVSLYVPED